MDLEQYLKALEDEGLTQFVAELAQDGFSGSVVRMPFTRNEAYAFIRRLGIQNSLGLASYCLEREAASKSPREIADYYRVPVSYIGVVSARLEDVFGSAENAR